MKPFLLPLLLIPSAVFAQESAPWVVGLPQLYRLDTLPALKRSVKIGAVTSYDRTGGNDDGFSGKYSFVRKEGDALVLADLKGPGCIYRIHTPTPTDDPLEFYFDGETTPRLRLTFNQMFSGKVPPFVRPLVDSAGGGSYCYVPIQYRKSCKVVVRAKQFQFYDLNYATYPEDAPVKTFEPSVTESDRKDLEKATAVFEGGRAGDLSAYNVPQGTKLRKQAFDVSLAAGKSATIFQTGKGGRIASLRIGPADAFVGKSRDILLKITWDGDKQPAVLCPAGDFFGYGWGKPAMGSALVGTYGGVNYCNLPMPFDRSAKIELISLKEGGSPIPIKGEIVFGDTPRKSYEGRFYAWWHRENPTTPGQPFTYLETQGQGHIVGLALQAQGMEPGSTIFFEGDDTTTVDGELVVHGTGSEDSFNGGWYDVPDRWDGPLARALSGCMLYQKPVGRTGAYRFFVGDAYSYRQSIRQTIEHGPEKNEVVTDYCATTYFYSRERPALDFAIPSAAMRTVIDPSRIVFPAHWTLPIASFSFKDAILSRTSVPADGNPVRCLSLRSKGEDFFGPPFLSVICDLPAAGRYKVYVDAVKGPEQGTIQLFRDDVAAGEAVDLYSAKPTQANGILMGEVSATEGANDVMFKIVGKNGESKALGFDLVNVVFVKM